MYQGNPHCARGIFKPPQVEYPLSLSSQNASLFTFGAHLRLLPRYFGQDHINQLALK